MNLLGHYAKWEFEHGKSRCEFGMLVHNYHTQQAKGEGPSGTVKLREGLLTHDSSNASHLVTLVARPLRGEVPRQPRGEMTPGLAASAHQAAVARPQLRGGLAPVIL